MDRYLIVGHKLLFCTFCVCAGCHAYMVFYQLIAKLYNKSFCIANTETLLKTPFSAIGRCSPVTTSHWLRKNAPEFTCLGCFRYDIQDHRRLLVSMFQGQIAAIGSLNRITESIFRICGNFIKAIKKVSTWITVITRHH